MKQPNFLIIVSESISLKKYDNVKYVFPLSSFCVGFTKTYNLNEIKVQDAYLYINRILNTSDFKNLQEIIKILPSNIKGIIFEDMGVYELVKHLNIEKILYALHANCSYYTINAYLEKVDSVVISPDITLEETKEILKNANKEVILYALGHLNYMYSRRLLNSNYAKYFNYEPKKILNLKENVTKMPFISLENEYGTVLYDDKIYNAHPLKDATNVKYFLINSVLTNLDTEDLIASFINDSLTNTTKRFLEQKTIYQLK